jgi:hypothetical protein
MTHAKRLQDTIDRDAMRICAAGDGILAPPWILDRESGRLQRPRPTPARSGVRPRVCAAHGLAAIVTRA